MILWVLPFPATSHYRIVNQFRIINSIGGSCSHGTAPNVTSGVSNEVDVSGVMRLRYPNTPLPPSIDVYDLLIAYIRRQSEALSKRINTSRLHFVEMSKQQRTGDWGASRRSRGTIANTSLTSRSHGHSNGYLTNGARQILSLFRGRAVTGADAS